MKYKYILFIVSMLLVINVSNVFAVDEIVVKEKYVDGTIWSVTDFDKNYHPKDFHPVPCGLSPKGNC
jgi:hypothetical protein